MAEAPPTPEPDLLARVRALTCGARLVAAAAGVPGVHLVGGAVRDLLLDRAPRELDVAVAGGAERLVAALGGARAAHDRFGTATVVTDGCRYDVAATRAETYPRPGALPEVRPASIDADLRRRDVTVNALALDLGGGCLRTVPDAREDLAARLLRVLHDNSFLDDPTRLWRVARYRARLAFTIEPHTAALAAAAVGAGALDTVSGARIGNELRLALREADAIGALQSAAALGLAPWLACDRERAAAGRALLPAEGRTDLLVLAACLRPAPAQEIAARLRALDFPAADVRVVLAAFAVAHSGQRPRSTRPSVLAAVFRDLPLEAVALADDRAAAAAWLGELRHVRLELTGDDLLAAGLAPGPEVGRRLAAVLAAVLDGDVTPGRASELAAALDM